MIGKLNLNALRVFAMAARHGSFHRAAQELNLSQGAVSQRIKQLEGDLGVTLFIRQPRGVALTSRGRALQAATEEALAILSNAVAALDSAGDQITLHLGPSFAARWLMPRMKDFRARFPQISLTTEIHDTPLVRTLGRNEIAIWPARDPGHAPAHHVRRLCPVQLSAVCSPEMLRDHWPVETGTLLRFVLLQDAHRRWERLIADTGHPGPHDILNFDRSALALDAALQGHGVAIAPRYMIEGDIAAQRLAEIWHSPTPSGEDLFVAWPRQHDRDKALNTTLEWILAEFGLAL